MIKKTAASFECSGFCMFYGAPRTGFEPMTYCLEGSCSIQLSYRGLKGCPAFFLLPLRQKEPVHPFLAVQIYKF